MMSEAVVDMLNNRTGLKIQGRTEKGRSIQSNGVNDMRWGVVRMRVSKQQPPSASAYQHVFVLLNGFDLMRVAGSGIRDLLGTRDSNPSYCLSDDAIFTYWYDDRQHQKEFACLHLVAVFATLQYR